MRHLMPLILFLVSVTAAWSQRVSDSAWCADVKSIFLTRNDIELEMPYIAKTELGEPTEQMMLRFDILGEENGDFRYRIRHCNADWELDGLDADEFISGMDDGAVEGYQMSFTTRQQYVNYYQLIPSEYSTFYASGNYVVEVYPSAFPDSIILTKRFCVYENLVDIDVSINKPSGAYGNVNSDQEVSVGVTPRQGSYLPSQPQYFIVKVQQNGREDLLRTLASNGYAGDAIMYRWTAGNVFPGGNCFRYFDISNLWAAMYHVQHIEQWGGETFAFLQPDEDRSGKAYSYYSSLNGGMKINIRERSNPQVEADYVWVNFSLPMERPFLNGSIHIVGELTQWHLDDNSRMEWQPQYKAYTKRLLLKQGYYSYQLLFLPTGEKEALTATLEGDHYVMGNSYTVYVYYRQPGARYDRLVGIRKATM